MESSSDRLVHWKRKPRSRIVCRKGDVSEARAFSSSAAEVSSSVDDVVDVDVASASVVDNRRVVCVLQNFTVGIVGLCKLKVRDDDAQVAATRRRLLLRKDER